AARLHEFLTTSTPQDNPFSPADVGWTLATGRSRFDHRAVVIGDDLGELLGQLRSLTATTDSVDTAVVTGTAGRAGKTVFVFPGQGSQWLGMGRQLYERFPVFAAALDAVVAELDPRLSDQYTRSGPGGLLDVMWGDDEHLLNQTVFTQAGLFAVEVALFELLRSWGVHADRVVGHSVGEIAAAYAAGVLSLADAATLVAARGRLMQALPAGGAMVAVQAGEAEVTQRLAELQITRAGIAAVNGPDAVVVSGVADEVTRIGDSFTTQGRKTTALAVSHAFHSVLMEPMLDEFAAAIADLTVSPPQIAVVSNLTGDYAGTGYGTPDYWVAHVREAVRFAQATDRLLADEATHFIEVGPGSALTAMVSQALAPALAGAVVAVSLLRKNRPEPVSVLTGLAAAFVTGADVDWAAMLAPYTPRWVDLPTYAFQR
ncbi:acyltransferase domain-containing protein, partial [Nocardia sp. NPDC059229]